MSTQLHATRTALLVLLTHKCLSGQASPYQQELITPQSVLRVPSISFALWDILKHPPCPAEGESALFFNFFYYKFMAVPFTLKCCI